MAGTMSKPVRNVLIAAAVVAVAAGAVWGGRYWFQRRGGGLQAQLAGGNPDELRAAMLALDKDKLETPEGKKSLEITAERMRGMKFAQIMEVMRGKDLTDEQRDHLREVGRETMMTYMNQRVDEFFAAPNKAEREKILDRNIDEMLDFQKQMQAYEEEHKNDPEHQAEREREWAAWAKRDTQQEKQRMEGGNPDQQKRMWAYFGQMRARAEARGIQPGGGPGRPGGPGGPGRPPGSRSERPPGDSGKGN